MFQYSDASIEALLDGVYNGRYTRRELPKSLYYAIADYLKKGAYKGFGGSLPDFTPGGTDYELLAELRENVYMFSAAKTYQQVREMSDLLRDGAKVRSYNEFKQEALQVFDTYNQDWLKAEYNTAIATAQMASKWNEIQKNAHVLPNLSYSTIGDACPICEPLNGTTLPVEDPFWSEFYPPNHFNCMCVVTQEEADAELTEPDDAIQLADEVGGRMDEVFKMNAGQDKVVFSEKSPYFTNVPKSDRGFARGNFGLPIPEED